MFRKKGISLLVPTRNAEQTVEMCIRSFAEFPDEIIVVDNGSTDSTKTIVRDLERKIPHLRFYDVPDLPDLYHNRQYAFEQSTYNWIVRIDSDYVAYTEGPRDIRQLRKRILETKRTFPPTAFGITQVNLFGDFWHTGRPVASVKLYNGVAPPIGNLPARIVQHYPGIRFQRLGRWEGVRFQRHLRHVRIEEPYWFHCTFKSEKSLFLRSERTNWREVGDFERYPTLMEYIQAIIPQKYGTDNFEDACRVYIENKVRPRIEQYDPEKYYPYPKIIQDAMDNGAKQVIDTNTEIG